ncbi:uncharacterized protein LOC113320798 [Papaver somniferum]|uniref:uncharacterized protein LOC113320798 n=1 Tax=Papaver somniferum TaxID=3469 RepID=UPI000E6F67BA|nr:uncharacterized protein LOC113320798 [Papaver somniferum]
MSGFWSATGDSNKSIRELAYGHTSHYKPPTDHDVNSYRDYYGHFHSLEPQYMNPNNYAHMYHPPRREYEHFVDASLTQSTLFDQLEARVTALEMEMHENSVTSDSPRQPEIYACAICGRLYHPVENCYVAHDFRQSRGNPRYEIPTDYDTGSHWNHNQPFEGCDQFLINSNDQEPMYQIAEDSPCIRRIHAYLDQIMLHIQNEGEEEFHHEMSVIPNEFDSENSVYNSTHASNIEHEPNIEVNEWTRDTIVTSREWHPCYDDDDDVMLC